MEPPDVLSVSEPMPLVMGDHHPSLNAGNVFAKGLDRPQGSHRIHIEFMSPGFVVDIAGLLPRRADNPARQSRRSEAMRPSPISSFDPTPGPWRWR